MSYTAALPTKAAILDAAEELFAAKGFKSTSLRAITSAANANLGAVNYHFESKDALILAVLSRRMRPLNERSLELLQQLENRSEPSSVEEILDALFRPPVELIAMRSENGRNFLRLIGFTVSEPGDFLRPLIEEQLAGKLHHFHTALKRVLPELSEEETFWKMHLSYGAFLHTVSNSHLLQLISGGRCQLIDSESTLGRIVAFCAAGFKSAAEAWKRP